MQGNLRHLAEEIRRDIEELLSRVGLLCRVFARAKDTHSLELKLNRDSGKYSNGGKLVQDSIGIRVALYFSEDVEVVKQLLCSKFEFDAASSTIDKPNNDQFAVSRYNLIYKIPDVNRPDMFKAVNGSPIDLTFEVQLRSILSEGWHEVEHDLRYKRKSNWVDHDDLSRTLNGIMATLETSEWLMQKLLDDLAHRHYKKGNWNGMLQNKLRMRVKSEISNELVDIFNSNSNFAKEIFRIDRIKVIFALSKLRPRVPVTFDNVIYIWNYFGPKDENVLRNTPELIKAALSDLQT
jgi:ppGpp synthetase/RelA/SpoT-type nucleotidyltranferase